MRLIDVDTLNYVRVRICHADGTIGGYNAIVPSSEIKNAPTVDAVPVSFIKEQIEKLQGIADYEFIESGGYLGECNHELGALQDLLKHWAERKKE